MPPAEPTLPAEEFAQRLARTAASFEVDLSALARTALSRYLAILDEARRRTNLTGRLGPDELVAHALESALGGRFLPEKSRVVDIGSGAGFPGLPLAIVRPDTAVLAVEPRRLRADFLARAVREVPVENAAAFCGKPGALASGSADVAVSRAVGGIETILRNGAFLSPGGLYLAWTTEPDRLAKSLESGFALEGIQPVPGARRKTIARFRKAAARAS